MAKDYGTSMDAYYVALGTPLKDDSYTIDFDAFRKLVKHFTDCQDFIDIGGGIIVLPEAGEIFTMTWEEKEELIKIAVEEGKGKLPVVSGVFAYNTKVTVEEAKKTRDLGVDGLFILPPGGTIDITCSLDKKNNPYPFLNLAQAIAEEVDLPFIAHAAGAVDSEYKIGYPVETVMKCVRECRNFVGWKMMVPFAAHLKISAALRKYEAEGGQHVGLLVAGAYNYFDAMNNRVIDGSVSCYWNYARDENIRLINAFQKGDFPAMQEAFIDNGLREIHGSASGDTWGMRLHTNFKVMAWLRGLMPNPYVREPMVQATKAEVCKYRDLLRKYGWNTIPDEEISRVLEKLPL